MKVLITGNLGYIGPSVVDRLKMKHPQIILVGYDAGYFEETYKDYTFLNESKVDVQYIQDIRDFDDNILNGVDAIVHLCAISNDPMGNSFEEVTMDINYHASVLLAKKAKERGVKSFVFASSCSVYGFAEDGARTEKSAVNPLTTYAKSKILTERFLESIASDDFKVTCLRFATACGMSRRLRLDLVLNDFVAGAIASNKLTILSDGTPWRPLIDTRDMATAIEWAIFRDKEVGGANLIINVGSDDCNYQVRDLAHAVKDAISGVEVSINVNAQPDKRSYRVGFNLFRTIAPNHQPVFSLKATIDDLITGLKSMSFEEQDFRNSDMIRLKRLNRLRDENLLTPLLRWHDNS